MSLHVSENGSGALHGVIGINTGSKVTITTLPDSE